MKETQLMSLCRPFSTGISRWLALLAVGATLVLTPASAQTLLHHWRLDDPPPVVWAQEGTPVVSQSTPVLDSVTLNSNSVIRTGTGSGHTAAVLFQQPGATVETGRSVKFGGTLDRAELGNLAPGNNPFTLALWFKLDAFNGSGQNDILSANNGQSGRWNLSLTPNGGEVALDFFHDGWGNGDRNPNSHRLSPAITPHRWHHVALTRDHASQFKIYFDGVETHSSLNNAVLTQTTDKGVWLARRPSFGVTGMIGWLDEVRFYDDALNPAQIVALLGSGPVEPLPAPLPCLQLAPGVVINYSPASSGAYIGSPSLAILDNGDYVASHDFFGPSTSYNRTVVFRSPNRGVTWQKVSEIAGSFWATLFVHDGGLYLIGTAARDGNTVIRRSLDRGTPGPPPSAPLPAGC
jgi:hypothetical protein